MEKPIIFFSHSSKDAAALARLKELFVEKTGGTIDVFLSSDGQSIPLGKNWVYAIEQALKSAAFMVVFVSPSSVNSRWMFFESGYAYSKGVEVIPVGFQGIDLSKIPPPLDLLQGFNIRSKESLDNLIHLSNKKFEHKHVATFSDEEYLEIVSAGGGARETGLGFMGSFIDNIDIHFALKDELKTTLTESVSLVENVLGVKNIEVQISGRDYKRFLNFPGVSITFIGDQITAYEMKLAIDPSMLEMNAETLSEVIVVTRAGGIQGTVMNLRFMPVVRAVSEVHKISAQLHGTDARLHSKRGFVFRGFRFFIGMFTHGPGDDFAYMEITIESDQIDIEQLRELLRLLETKGILCFRQSMNDM